MFALQGDGAGSFGGADPDGAGAADEGEGIVADDFAGAFESELDAICGEVAKVAVFVVDAEDNADGVGAIGDEPGFIGKKDECLIGAGTGVVL